MGAGYYSTTHTTQINRGLVFDGVEVKKTGIYWVAHALRTSKRGRRKSAKPIRYEENRQVKAKLQYGATTGHLHCHSAACAQRDARS